MKRFEDLIEERPIFGEGDIEVVYRGRPTVVTTFVSPLDPWEFVTLTRLLDSVRPHLPSDVFTAHLLGLELAVQEETPDANPPIRNGEPSWYTRPFFARDYHQRPMATVGLIAYEVVKHGVSKGWVHSQPRTQWLSRRLENYGIFEAWDGVWLGPEADLRGTPYENPPVVSADHKTAEDAEDIQEAIAEMVENGRSHKEAAMIAMRHAGTTFGSRSREYFEPYRDTAAVILSEVAMAGASFWTEDDSIEQNVLLPILEKYGVYEREDDGRQGLARWEPTDRNTLRETFSVVGLTWNRIFTEDR